MCVDYSDLNKACPKDSFPLPNIDAMVDAVAGYRFLSFMDAYSGYNQIPMQKFNEEKMAFITPGGTYCYRVMPFGLKNVGATYQRLMNRVFSDLIEKSVEIYVDDILVKTSQLEDLVGDLETAFMSLRRHNMRLNLLKCAFAMEAGKFLGFMITQRGLRPTLTCVKLFYG
ncbi:Transposon Ty3-I Gag-Pol polyprotein [Arachis hypogaea]|nr:Transposon Ty3-I Gag-Pol polyprotein [Arachis hypogaea]